MTDTITESLRTVDEYRRQAVNCREQSERAPNLRNPAQRGHRFQRKADSIPVIADSR